MKSIVSSEALQSSLELANSNTPPLDFSSALFIVNPRPSDKFFSTLFFGSAGNFLASPPGNFPLHEFKIIKQMHKKVINFIDLYEDVVECIF